MALYIQATKDGQDYILYPTENIPIRLDISTIESGEIGEVFSDLSQSFTFAATEEHNRFFSNAFTVGGQVVPGTSTKVPVTINSEKETLFAGSLLLNSWNESSKTYSCSLSSGIGDLSSELEDKVLADADWTALVHPYTMDQALAVNNQQTMPDYFYPLVDLGYDKGGRPFVPDDVELPGVSSTETYNPSPNQHNVDYYQETYNTYGFNYQTAQSNRLISPSIYFGAIAEGPVTQGYITHPMTPLRIDQLLPAISIKSVLDRIFQQANATYEAGFLNMLSDLYILPKATAGLGFSGDFTDDKGFISTSASSYRVPDVNVNNSADKSSGGRTIWTYGADSPTVTATFNEGSNFTASTGVYVAPETGTYSFTFKCQVGNQVGTIDNVFNNAYWNSRFAILVNGREIKAVDTPRIGNNGSFNGGDNYEVEIDSGDLLIYANQRVEAKWISGPSRSADNFSLEVIGPEFRTTKVPVNFNGLDINPGMQFGDTTSLDVLQALVRKLNLAIVPDKNVRGHYIIHQYYDWILSGNRVDWTERVSNIEHQPVLSDLEREIVFTDAEDDDRLNAFIQDSFQDTIYGQHKYVSSSDITEGSETIGDFFGPLINASVPDAGDITKSIVPDPQNGIPHLYEYDPADGATSMEPAIRIGYRKPIIINSNIYYANSSNSVVKYDLHRFLTLSNTNWNRTRDINFSNQYSYSNPSAEGAYDTYWKQYVDHLYQPGARKITCDVQFNPSDYTTLNIQDTVHIDGSDYLINKINGFNLSRPDVVEVELITYNNNFTNVFEEPVNRFIEDDSIARTHILGIQAIGYDGDPATADVIPMSIQPSHNIYDFSGDPAQGSTPASSETFTLTFATQEGLALAASNFSSNVGSLTGVSHTALTDVGDGTVSTDVTLTIGSDHQYSRLEFKSEVDPVIEGTNDFTIDFTENIDDTVIMPDPVVISGQPNSRQTFTSFISPSANKQLDSSTFSTGVLPAGVNSVTFVQQGFSIAMVVNATIPVLDNQTSSLTITGNAPTDIPVGTLVSTLEINFNETTSNLSVYPTTFRFQGVAGTTGAFPIVVSPASGYSLDADTVTGTEVVASALTSIGNATQNGDDVILPVTWILSGTDGASATVNVTVSGSPVRLGGDNKNVTLSFNTASLNSNLNINQSASEVLTMPRDGILRYYFEVFPDPGWMISGVPNITTTDSSVATVDSVVDGGGGVYNVSLTVNAATANDGEATISVTAAAVEEPFRYTMNLGTSGLTYASINRASYGENFGISDLASRQLADVTFQVASTHSSRAFTSADQVTVMYDGVGITPSFSGGIVSFTVSPTIASSVTANNIADFSGDLIVSGAPLEASDTDALVEVILDITDSVDNATVTPTANVTVSGPSGTTATYIYTATPNTSAYEVLPGNISVIESSGIIRSIPDYETGNSSTAIPIEITFPGSNPSAPIALTIDGDATLKPVEGIDLFNYSLSMSLTGSGYRAGTAYSNTFRGVPGQRVEGVILIEAEEGVEIDAALNGSAPSGVVLGSITSSKNSVSIPITVTIGSSNSSGNTIPISVNVTQNEPYLHTINWGSDGLTNAYITQPSQTFRFGSSDIGATTSNKTITICPNDGEMAFTSTTAPTFPALANTINQVGSGSISDGCVTYTYNVSIPSNTTGNIVINRGFSGTAILPPATQAQWGNNRYSTGFSSGSVTISVTANGTWGITGGESGGTYPTGVSATATGTSSETGSVTISWGTVTAERSFSVLVTDSTGVNVLASLNITQESMTSSISGGLVRRSYDLTASLIQPTVFLYQPQPGATQNATVPAGDATSVFSYVTPTIVSGAGNGASVTGGELAESTTGDSGSVGGFTIVTQSSAPSGVPSTQITFVT